MTAHAIDMPEWVSKDSVAQLALIEARRSLRRVSIWVGLGLTIVILTGTTSDWPSGSYSDKLPLSFMPIVFGTFIASFRTGRRDGQHDVSEGAPLDIDHRALARFASLAFPVLLTVVLVVGVAIVSRIEGGFWLGDQPRRTDTALHSLAELVQMPLVVAFVGAAGIAIGRIRPRAGFAIAVIAGAVLFTLFPGYWIWNIPPIHTITPVQTQPMFIKLDAATDVNETPVGWFVEFSEGDDNPTRQLVHQPTILGHTVYLLGLAVLAAGLAIRKTRGRTMAMTGAVVAVVGVAAQLIVSPL